MRFCCLGIIAALSLASPALADSGSSRAAADAALAAAASGDPANAAAVSLEQHFTTNALDSDLQFSDFYTDLRGSITHVFGDKDKYLRFGAQAQATKYHRISIEDDRSLLLLAEAYRKFAGRYEIRGTLTWRTASIGDDLRLADLAIGTRTHSDIIAGALQFGADLGANTALVVEASDTVERYGKAHFQQDLIETARLEPNRNRLRFSAGLQKTIGKQQVGVTASAETTQVDRLGAPLVGLSFNEFGLRGVARLVSSNGLQFDASIGAAFLQATNGAYGQVRPAYRFELSKTFSGRLKLRGSLAGGFETVDTDDALASYLQRLELEAKLQWTADFAFSAGVFLQDKENLLLDNVERSKGAYVEIGYDVSKHVTLVGRIDFSHTLATVVDTRKNTLDTYFGIRTKL